MAGNANRWLGIVRDFGFYHASPFGRAELPLVFALYSEGTLIGGIHLTAGGSGLSAAMTPFAMGAGGGVNLRLSPRAALRPGADYIAVRSRSQTLNSGRASFGIVFRFGGG